MIIAHLPAGFLLSRALPRPADRRWLLVGLLGSVFPDLDLLWFYLVDARRHHHHDYWTHLPAWWIGITLVTIALVIASQSRSLRNFAILFLPNVFLHLVLDTVAGGIRWMHPFSWEMWVLVEVPPRYGWWLWNFLLHPTFLVEIVLLGTAVAFALSDLRRSKGAAHGNRSPASPAP